MQKTCNVKISNEKVNTVYEITYYRSGTHLNPLQNDPAAQQPMNEQHV
jgi:hypothetical protein